MGFLINPFVFATAGGGGPAPTFEAVGTLAEQGNPVAYPAGLEANDIAFIHVHLDDSLKANAISPPSGWNIVLNHNLDNSTVAHGLFWKRLDGTESGTLAVDSTTGLTANDSMEAVMSIWRGCVASGTPYEGMASNGPIGSANMTGADCTTAGANRLVVYFGGHTQQATCTPAVGWTEIYDLPSSNGVPEGALHCLTIEQASAGTVTGTSHTLSASRGWDVISLALIPA